MGLSLWLPVALCCETTNSIDVLFMCNSLCRVLTSQYISALPTTSFTLHAPVINYRIPFAHE